jgi:Pin2-interacting protein X1
VTFKDDMLGLGAKMKSKDVEHSRAGLDAFQGLLGRLNGKSDVDLRKEEQKAEDRKLAMWAQGKWGGMIFVPGGLLVQGEAFKKNDDNVEASETKESSAEIGEDVDEAVEKARKKEERRRKKAEKKQQEVNDEVLGKAKRREERWRKHTKEVKAESAPGGLSADLLTRKREQPDKSVDIQDNSEDIGESEGHSEKKRKKQKSENLLGTIQASTPLAEPSPKPVNTVSTQGIARNGRHILRGKNIQAKKMAFGDAKMLDEVFEL